MTWSIRTRLTILFALVFLAVLTTILAAAGIAFYIGVTGDLDRALGIEEQRVLALFEEEFAPMVRLDRSSRDYLLEEFTEDLEEMYRYTRRFTIFTLETDGSTQIFEGGDDSHDYEAFMHQTPEARMGGYYRQVGDKLYRIRRTRHEWGTLLLAAESPILLEVAGRLGGILLVVLPVTFIVVLAGGRFLAGRAMRPVLSAAQAAEKITLTNLSERLPPYAGQDEFGRLQATLNHMIDRLEEGIRHIQQFTQDAAHELRSPLAILRGELELSYQHDRLPDEVRDGLQKSLDRTIAMSDMVENLMLLARSDAGQFKLEKSPVRFDEILTDVMDDIQILAEPCSVEVTIDRCDQTTCPGDEQLIRRLLLNLADNALKYTPEDRISVSLVNNGTHLEYTIRDTGVGIPEADLAHIFDRFYRVDASRNRDNGGSGLGLAICHWIVTAHGGDIRIESAVNKGTTITLTLPV